MNTESTSRPSIDSRLESRSLGSLASAGILGCGPDAPLEEVAALMSVNRVHAIVVVDDRRADPPVISDLDLVAAMASGQFSHLTASDIAGTEAISAFADESLGRAAQLLSEHRVSHLVVRDEHRQPIGVVSSLDLAIAISEGAAVEPSG